MRTYLLPVLAAALFFVAIGCDTTPDKEKESLEEPTLQEQKAPTFEVTGRVAYLELEGGGWVIESNSGITYEPLNLAKQYKKQDLPVRVVATKRPDRMSVLQVGPIIEIQSIESLADTTTAAPSDSL